MIEYDNQGKSYDLIATGFANMRDEFYLEQKYLDLLISYLKPGAHILDVGCGSGHPIAAYFIEHGFAVTGIDGSKELLKIAKVKCPKLHTIYGDIRTVAINAKYDAVLEWWCLFHVPKNDHEKMLARFSQWLKPGGFLEFTSGDTEYEHKSSDMLNQELAFYSLAPELYEKYLKGNGFKLLLRENDQEHHTVWLAQKL
jgi:2-polyprenyl-3-methyl-5-hydroxy-6-metoxy-1,4-benzoquinol methylase